jgi:hypothetical protein
VLERESLAPITDVFIKELGLSLIPGLDDVLNKPRGYGVQVDHVFIFSPLLVKVDEMPPDRLLVYTG